jgi:predicted DNA-binding WGR domain protein
MKWILVKKSDGERGNAGLKKIYQVIVEDNKVITLWGKAEDVSAQAKQVKSFAYPFLAKAYANDKVQSKITRGYEVVLVA